METGLPLGILPLGTANDLARTLEIPSDPAAAAAIIVEGHLRRIDLGEVNGKPFFNVASLGLSTGMTRELTHDVKQRWGMLGYAVATFRALSRMRPFAAEIRSGGTIRKVHTLQISIGNGRHYGGGMTVEEDAEIETAASISTVLNSIISGSLRSSIRRSAKGVMASGRRCARCAAARSRSGRSGPGR